VFVEAAISDIIAQLNSMRNVPRPIIDAVVRETLDALVNILPPETTIDQLSNADWHACEACNAPLPLEHTHSGEDGVCLCESCAVSEDKGEPEKAN